MQVKTLLLRQFGRQLQLFRKQLMLSREDLGLKTGLTIKDIEDLEAGIGDPALSTISLLAEALNLSSEELVFSSSGHDAEYYAYRFHILQIVNSMSKNDLKKSIRKLEST